MDNPTYVLVREVASNEYETLVAPHVSGGRVGDVMAVASALAQWDCGAETDDAAPALGNTAPDESGLTLFCGLDERHDVAVAGTQYVLVVADAMESAALWRPLAKENNMDQETTIICDLPRSTYLVTDPSYVVADDVWRDYVNEFSDAFDARASSPGRDRRAEHVADAKLLMRHLSRAGIVNGFAGTTVFGDCSPVVTDSLGEPVDARATSGEDGSQRGQYGIDSGCACVLDAEEVYYANPETRTFVEEHPWCVATIEDFEGTLVADYSRADRLMLTLGGHVGDEGERVTIHVL